LFDALDKNIYRFRTSITGEPVGHEKKILAPQIYLATQCSTHNRKRFVDIWYGLREKRLSRVGPVIKKITLKSYLKKATLKIYI
jgi:hypothetical protein